MTDKHVKHDNWRAKSVRDPFDLQKYVQQITNAFCPSITDTSDTVYPTHAPGTPLTCRYWLALSPVLLSSSFSSTLSRASLLRPPAPAKGTIRGVVPLTLKPHCAPPVVPLTLRPHYALPVVHLTKPQRAPQVVYLTLKPQRVPPVVHLTKPQRTPPVVHLTLKPQRVPQVVHLTLKPQRAPPVVHLQLLPIPVLIIRRNSITPIGYSLNLYTLRSIVIYVLTRGLTLNRAVLYLVLLI